LTIREELDLFSNDNRITVGDMHDIPFEEDSFDVLISVDNMEHAYDPAKALSEFRRVVKSDGIMGIEVPVNFQTNATDRHDFKSLDNLLRIAGIDDARAVVFYEALRGPTYEKIRVSLRNP
jgi:ubiquinone/menaquinone biosynthesis C-methylase UbiE